MSNYIVSARKYRPTRFDEVVGQNHVSKTLKNALKTDHLGHSFLFCGPRGVGKTTSARILAKVLNCENKKNEFEPCNECSSCEAFNNNASFNIYELDAASNNSVDDIRSLVDQVRFPPQQGDYKVYIIDEVHMLTQAAFNAFLKTLEEPPSYAIFILATTEKHKIIPTILSRCQIFDFKRVQVEDIVQHLQKICTQEGIEAEEAALHTIAQKADGALRDALSIFDRIVSYAGKNLTYQTVTESLNILDYDTFFELTTALITQNKNKTLTMFNSIVNRGFEGDQVILGLAEHFRNLMVAKEPEIIELLSVANNVKEQYVTQAKQAKLSFLINAINICNQCDIQYKTAKNKRLHVELALLKICYLGNTLENVPLEGKKKRLEPANEDESIGKELNTDNQSEPVNKTNQPQESSSIKEEKEKIEPKPIVEVTPTDAPKPTTEIPIDDSQEQTVKDKPVESLKPKKVPQRRASAFSLSQLNSQIESKKEEEKRRQAEVQQVIDKQEQSEISLDEEMQQKVYDVWYALADIFSRQGATTLENAIKQSKIVYENNLVDVTVQGEIAKSMLEKQYTFIVNYIKDETKLPKFNFKLTAAEIQLDNVKTFTREEQLHYLMNKNEAVALLVNQLNLEIDYGGSGR